MTRWKYAAVITFVLGSVGVSYLLRSTKTSPAAAPAVPKSLGCRFAVGDTLAYKLHTSSSASGAAAGQGGSLQLDAMMWWKVLAQKGGGWVVAGSLQEVRMAGGAEADSASTAQLTDPFVFTIGTDCRFSDPSFLPTTEASTRRKLEGLLRSTEFVFSSRPQWTWVHRQIDLLGTYDASYSLYPSDVSPL